MILLQCENLFIFISWSDPSLVFADILSLALGVMPAWCGPEQILFIFNQISARIRTELELGWWGGRWRHRRGVQGAHSDRADGTGAVSRQLPSYTSVPRQFTSFSFQTCQADRTVQEPGHRSPPKCVQRKPDQRAGPRHRRARTNESQVLGGGWPIRAQYRVCIARPWPRELSWWRRRAAPGSADSRTVQRHLVTEDTQRQHWPGSIQLSVWFLTIL